VEKPLCLVLGNVDGVHRGHQTLLKTAVRIAEESGGEPALMRLEPHPKALFGSEKQPWMIQNREETMAILRYFGVPHLLAFPFNARTSRFTPESFFNFLIENIRVSHLVVGENYKFGAERRGDPDTLKVLAGKHGIKVHVCEHIEDEGGILSSSRIRAFLKSGDVVRAGEMLGRPCFISGEVIEGLQKGRDLGAPTANLESHGLLWPSNGVYATWTKVQNNWFPSISHIGHRPTRPTSGFGLETHILDADLDLYHQHILVAFTSRIREERTFDSFSRLSEQIQKDILLRKSLADYPEKGDFGPLEII
jgi:riboflavin kinase/FMN adenylyltransferase